MNNFPNNASWFRQSILNVPARLNLPEFLKYILRYMKTYDLDNSTESKLDSDILYIQTDVTGAIEVWSPAAFQ